MDVGSRPRRQAATNVSYKEIDLVDSVDEDGDDGDKEGLRLAAKTKAKRGKASSPAKDSSLVVSTKGQGGAVGKENTAAPRKGSSDNNKARGGNSNKSNKVALSDTATPRRRSNRNSASTVSYADQLSDDSNSDDRSASDSDTSDKATIVISDNDSLSSTKRVAVKTSEGKISKSSAALAGNGDRKKSNTVTSKSSKVVVDKIRSSDKDVDSESDKDVDGDDDDNDSLQYRIQYVLGKKSMPQSEWQKITDSMYTKETIRGSIWTQPDEEYFDNSPVPVEKFLIKWAHASFLHVSWENERDLLDMVGPSAKSHLKRFQKREEKRIDIFEDLRFGEYFLPAFLQIERVLDIHDETGVVNVCNVDFESAKVPMSESAAFPVHPSNTGANSGVTELDLEEWAAAIVPDSMECGTHTHADDVTIANEVDSSSVDISMDASHSNADDNIVIVDAAEFEDSNDDNHEEEKEVDASPRGGSGTSRGLARSTKTSLKPAVSTSSRKGKAAQDKLLLHSDDCWLLVKWQNLPYSEAKFEHINDLRKAGVEYEDKLRSFYRREQLPPANAKVLKENSSRHLNKELMSEVQPLFNNGGILRDYQWEGVRWLLFNWSHRRNCILADEMGLGKTIQTAAFLQLLRSHQNRRGPFLVVAPLSTIINWQREVQAWTAVDVIVFHGLQEDRDIIVEQEFHYSNNRHKGSYKLEIVVTTPEVCLLSKELAAIHWDAVVIDEAHKLKNYDSKISSTLRDEFVYECCLLLTGTPLQNNMEELWTLLNFVARKDFADKDAFMALYGDMQTSTQLEKLYKHIKPYLLRREKNLVESKMPPKKEVVIEVEMTAPQKQYYRALIEEKTGFLYKNGGGKDGPSLTNLAMELRKCCNHPFLIKGAQNVLAKHFENSSPVECLVNSSGKLILLDKLLPKLKADGHRVLIFSQFRMMLNILEDYIDAKGYSYERVDGAVTGSKRQAAIDRYQVEANKDLFIMLLSTRAGGVGINLTAADTVIIFDSDWNPQNDIQAQARAHRIGQTRAVTVYRLLTRKTYETAMFQAASMKLGLDYAIMHKVNKGSQQLEGISAAKAETASSISKKELENLLKHGAYDIFKEEREGQSLEESKKFCDEDIDEILQRSSILMHEEDKNAALVTEAKEDSSTLHRGTQLSKASFVSGDGGEGLAIDDPDFWEKVVGISHEESLEDLGNTRKCKSKVVSYKEMTAAQFREAFASSSDDDDEKRERSPRKQKEEEKVVLERANWSTENVSKLVTLMCNFGYTNWDLLSKGDNTKLNFFKRDIVIGSKWAILQLLLQSSIIISSSSSDASAFGEVSATSIVDDNDEEGNKKERSPRNKDKEKAPPLLGKYDMEYLELYIKKNKLVKHILIDFLCKFAERGSFNLESLFPPVLTSPFSFNPDQTTQQQVETEDCFTIMQDESRSFDETCGLSFSKTEADIYELLEEKLLGTCANISSSLSTGSNLLMDAEDQQQSEQQSTTSNKEKLASFLTHLIKSSPLIEAADDSNSNSDEHEGDKAQDSKRTKARARLALIEELFAIKVFSKKSDSKWQQFNASLSPNQENIANQNNDIETSDASKMITAVTEVDAVSSMDTTTGNDSLTDSVDDSGFNFMQVYDKLGLASYAPNWVLFDDMLCMSLVSKLGWPDSKRRFIQFMDMYKTEKLATSLNVEADGAAIDAMCEYATFSKFLTNRIREIAKAMAVYCNPKVVKEKAPKVVKEKVEKPVKVIECNPKKLFNSVIDTFKEFGKPFDYIKVVSGGAASSISPSSFSSSSPSASSFEIDGSANDASDSVLNRFSWAKFIELCDYSFVTEEYCESIVGALDSAFQAFVDNLEIKESDVISSGMLEGHKYSMVEALVEKIFHMHQLRAIIASCDLPVTTTHVPSSLSRSSNSTNNNSNSNSNSADNEMQILECAAEVEGTEVIELSNSSDDFAAISNSSNSSSYSNSSSSSSQDALLQALIAKYCKGLGESVPLFKRDTTVPVWWTLSHDLKMLKFLVQNGLSWKKVCSEAAISSANPDFVMPSRAGHSDKDDLIIALTPKIAEKRFLHIIQSIYSSKEFINFKEFVPEFVDRKMKDKSKSKGKSGGKLPPAIANRTFGQMPSWVLSVKSAKAPSSNSIVISSSSSSSKDDEVVAVVAVEANESDVGDDVSKGVLKRPLELTTSIPIKVNSPVKIDEANSSSNAVDGKRHRSSTEALVTRRVEFVGIEVDVDCKNNVATSETSTTTATTEYPIVSVASNDGGNSMNSSNEADDSTSISASSSSSSSNSTCTVTPAVPKQIVTAASATKKADKVDKGDKVTPLKKDKVVAVATGSASKTPQSIAAFPDWLLSIKKPVKALDQDSSKAKDDAISTTTAAAVSVAVSILPLAVDLAPTTSNLPNLTLQTDVSPPSASAPSAAEMPVDDSSCLGGKRALVRTLTDASITAKGGCLRSQDELEDTFATKALERNTFLQNKEEEVEEVSEASPKKSKVVVSASESVIDITCDDEDNNNNSNTNKDNSAAVAPPSAAGGKASKSNSKPTTSASAGKVTGKTSAVSKGGPAPPSLFTFFKKVEKSS